MLQNCFIKIMCYHKCDIRLRGIILDINLIIFCIFFPCGDIITCSFFFELTLAATLSGKETSYDEKGPAIMPKKQHKTQVPFPDT